MAQLEGIKTLTPRGAIVKYNPCTRHARGSQCLYFDGMKKCGKPPLTCEMPKYDKWYKDVLKGEKKNYYPYRIRLFETPNAIMFLFHAHHHAIMGEAQIVRSTTEDGSHLYWFDEFISYSHPVQLELLETDPRLPRKGRRGRWLFIYISPETIEEIRSLSKLSEGERKKLGKDLEKIIEQMKKPRFYKLPRQIWKFSIKNEYDRLRRDYRIDEQVLTEAREYFSEVFRKGLSRGHFFYEMLYASLYLAFRMLKIPKLLNDITEISGVSQRKLGKLYRLLVREFNLIVPPLDPEQLIMSYSSRLDISKSTTSRAVSLVRGALTSGLIKDKPPSSIAAAATFVACQKEGEKRTQKQIAKIFDVSEVTIRNYSKKLKTL